MRAGWLAERLARLDPRTPVQVEINGRRAPAAALETVEGSDGAVIVIQDSIEPEVARDA